MNSGCICCSLVGDFGEALKEVIQKYEPDRIIIEPSGVGKLSDVIKAVKKVEGEVDIKLNSFTNTCGCYEMQNVSQKLRRILRESGKERRNHHPEPYR